jgi:hypothetical protein
MDNKKLQLWVVEIREPEEEHWSNCVSVGLTRRDAEQEAKYDWKTQGFKTRVRKYIPEKG